MLKLAILVLSLATTVLRAFEAVGTIERVDADKSMIQLTANGQGHTVSVAKDIQVFDADGKTLADGLKAVALKAGAEITVTIEQDANGPVVHAIHLGNRLGDGAHPPNGGKASIGLKPLTEMTADDKYKGEDGGLYGNGKNEPPPAHMAAAKKETARIQPLDAEGAPNKGGKIGLVSISMSNATMEYSRFKQLADVDARKSPQVVIVDCAQGGQAMAQWVDPHARPWEEAVRRLAMAQLSPKQVQVIWVKLANVRPTGELSEHSRKLAKDTLLVLQNARARFPNLRIAYLGSRIYAGYAATPLNPEPYAYEGAFAVRWLIQDQDKGEASLAYEDAHGVPKAPLLLWGPYFWADGTTPRKSDGLIWERADLGGDGTHPSVSGRQKVAEMLLKFFTEDPLASTWFVKK